jgi:hypothetical protein
VKWFENQLLLCRPNLAGKSSGDIADLEDRMRALEMEHGIEIEQLRKRHVAEIQQMKVNILEFFMFCTIRKNCDRLCSI